MSCHKADVRTSIAGDGIDCAPSFLIELRPGFCLLSISSVSELVFSFDLPVALRASAYTLDPILFKGYNRIQIRYY